MKKEKAQLKPAVLHDRTNISAGGSCSKNLKTWWKCYTGWLSRGGGFGNPDAGYYQCKKNC